MQKSIFPQKFKKVCVLQRKHVDKLKIQTQLQRFRGCRKNKKCSIFHKLSEYQQKSGNIFSHWTGPFNIKKKGKIFSNLSYNPVFGITEHESEVSFRGITKTEFIH